VAEHLTVDVVGEAFRGAVRVADAQHFAVGLALNISSLPLLALETILSKPCDLEF
jgi:hypothetical protein